MFTTVMTNFYRDQLNAGFSKVCEIFKVCSIESLKYVPRVFTHRSVTVPKFPLPEKWCWMKLTVIGCLTCRSYVVLMGGSWPIKAAIDYSPSAITPDSHILRLQCLFFSAPMFTDQSVHTARGCGPAVRSRSGAAAAVQSLFLLCCMRWIKVSALCSR